MRDQGTRLRLVVGLLCLAALAALFATAGGGLLRVPETQDADAGQTPAPAEFGAATASPNAYFRALREAQLTDSSGPTLAWSGVGQGSIGGGYGPSDTLPPFSGRGTSIAVSAGVSTDKTAYLGTSDGGVWKTTDDGVTWRPVFDNEPTLAIGAVAVDPTNADNVYAGTGEANWQLQGGQILLGNGIYRSTNGGTTWARAAIPFSSGYMGGGCGVESLAVDPNATNVVLAAVFCPGTTNASATAIIRSTDNGTTWSGVGPAVGGSEDQTPMLTEDPSHPAIFYATISATGGLGGVWKSTDSGATWTQKFHSVPSEDASSWTAPRGVVAVAPTDSSRLYALFEATYACPQSGQGSCLDCPAGACGDVQADPQLWTSDDGGDTWTEFTNYDDTYQHTAAYWMCSSNTCSSTLTMAVSPSDPSKVYVGSIFARSFTDSGGQTSCTYYCTSAAPIHADDRAYVFDTEGRLWVANDGGVYRFASGSDYDSSADNLNADLPTIQIYRLSVGSDGKILIATQDQGCDLFDPNTQVWSQLGWGSGPVGCGDSVSAVLSSVHPGVMYAGIQFNQWIVRSPQSPPTDPPYPTDIIFGAGNSPFMAPLVEEPGSGALLTGGDGKVWRLANPDTTPGWSGPWVAISPAFQWYPGAIAVANAQSATQTIYVGSSAYSNSTNQMAIEVTHDGGTTWTAGNGCCGVAPVTDIEVDPSHPLHAYATTSSWPPQAPRAGITSGGGTSQVYETTDGGANWHVITGSLPAAPFNAISVDWSFSKQTIYVATDVGIFWSEDDGAIWHATSSGMPSVSTEDLAIQTVDGTRSLYAATFGRGVYSVPTITTALQTLSVAESGSGTVASTDTHIGCGSACAYDYATNASVTLTATPASGWTFTGWSGGCSGTTNPCTVSMTAAKSVTANFILPLSDETLTVSETGAGSGTVTSSPSGINCGSTCSHSFSNGASVTLTATAAAGSTFAGWSGACSGTATCHVSMTTARSVTAAFALPGETLTVAKQGSGTVTSGPSGISCGSTCSHSFANGTAVTLTASAAAGSTFSGWSGDCSGTSSTCQLTMSAAHSVTATFESTPPPPPDVHCVVPKVVGKKLAAAKSAIENANCSVGTVRKKKSSKRKGTVISQSPAPRTKKAEGALVNLTVSKGK